MSSISYEKVVLKELNARKTEQNSDTETNVDATDPGQPNI